MYKQRQGQITVCMCASVRAPEDHLSLCLYSVCGTVCTSVCSSVGVRVEYVNYAVPAFQ